MTTPTPIEAARERVDELRTEMLSVMFDGNSPLVDYYGPNDPVYAKHHKRCVDENTAQLDGFIAAIRAATLDEVRELAWPTMEQVRQCLVVARGASSGERWDRWTTALDAFDAALSEEQ